jgi:N-methylhydantoinase A
LKNARAASALANDNSNAGGPFDLAVDIGGTFTDIVLSDAAGTVWPRKVPTTPGDLGRAVAEGATLAIMDAGIDPAAVARVVHGSTIGTNAILERKGPRVGLVTTQGFRDVLEIARIRTPRLFDLAWEKPVPLVARRHRVEVVERISATGEILVPLDMDSVVDAVARLDRAGVTTIAVCLINAYVRGDHEEAIRDYIRTEHPQILVSLSSSVLPEMREYERTSTTVVNAFLQPVLRSYLRTLSARLADIGIRAPLEIMRSDGGAMAAEAAAERPVSVVVSGPAAGVRAVQRLATLTGYADMLAFDMGGTTAKAALVEGGRASLVNEYEVRAGISTPSRFVKAGGYLLMVPAVDLAEVGNGAGSIARVDAAGALRVGPDSAGASPGPACYGRGGAEATITDANVWLGYLSPHDLVGGDLDVHAPLARRAIEDRVAKPLGLSVTDAAWGIHVLANSNMRRALRAVTVERGRDPRDFTLTAFGGSGPVHATGLAEDLGIRRVVVPGLAGVFSSAGMLVAGVEHRLSRSWVCPLDEVNAGDLASGFAKLESDLRAEIRDHSGADAELAIERLVDLRYASQALVVSLPLRRDTAELAERFEDDYRRTYGDRLERHPIELVALRVVGRAGRTTERRFQARVRSSGSREHSRDAYFGSSAGYVATPLFSYGELSGEVHEGPLIIETYDTTIVVRPNWQARLDEYGNVVLEFQP